MAYVVDTKKHHLIGTVIKIMKRQLPAGSEVSVSSEYNPLHNTYFFAIRITYPDGNGRTKVMTEEDFKKFCVGALAS